MNELFFKESLTYQLATSSGKYPQRLDSEEFTQEVLDNLEELERRLIGLFTDLGLDYIKLFKTITSGFRPSAVNKAVGGAKKSAHTQGKAVDFQDNETQTLGVFISKNPELLHKWGLMIENPQYTKNWVHLDMVERSYRPSCMFNP